MLSTRDVLNLLRDANPGVEITEDRVRHVIRRGEIDAPSSFAGRLVWAKEDVEALAAALRLACPADSWQTDGGRS